MLLSELKLNPDNPRTIKQEKLEKLAQSIKDFPKMMIKRPIVYDENKVIIGGNMRYRAIQSLGMKEIPDEWVSDASDFTPDERYRFIMQDNAEMGEHDWDAVANQYELEDLEAWGIDVPYADSTEEVEEDEPPEVGGGIASSVLGTVYQLGRHRVMCGDSTVKENVDLLMGGVLADMVFTDPPYGVDYSGGIQFTKDGVKKNQRERLKDDQYGTDIYTEVIPIIASITNGAVYTWFAGSKGKSVYEAIEKVGEIHALIIWKKNGGYSSMNANYKENKEPCLYWKPKNGKLNFIGKTTETTVWDLDKEGKNEYHPTQKPIALCAKAINNHSGKLVADLFLGSGSTLIACEQTDRTCYGCELDPKYVDVIRRRYWKFVNGGDETGWEEGTPAL